MKTLILNDRQIEIIQSAIMAKLSQLNAETSELLSIYSLCNNETSDQSSEPNKEEDKQ